MVLDSVKIVKISAIIKTIPSINEMSSFIYTMGPRTTSAEDRAGPLQRRSPFRDDSNAAHNSIFFAFHTKWIDYAFP